MTTEKLNDMRAKTDSANGMITGLAAFAFSVLENRDDDVSVEWSTVAGLAAQCSRTLDDLRDLLASETADEP